jgi:hypothetical protein
MFGRLRSSTARGALRIAIGDGTDITDNILMHGPAWDMPNLLPLWFNGEVRGNDVLLPGATGVIPFRRRFTVTGYSLPLIITGRVDIEGVPPEIEDEVWEQLETNVQYLNDNIVAPPGTTSGIRLATLTMPSGAEREAEIHVLGITPGIATDGIMKATLDISIPAGRFV